MRMIRRRWVSSGTRTGPKRGSETSGGLVKNHPSHTPLLVNDAAVEQVRNIKFLGIYITDTLSWSLQTSDMEKKAQQCLHFFSNEKNKPPLSILTTFYRGTIENKLTSSISVWFGASNISDWERIERVARTAERIIRTELPTILDTTPSHCLSRAQPIRKTLPPSLWSVLSAALWEKVQQLQMQNNQIPQQLHPS
ncbi:hypothetical protein CCH79_00016587, partial [Gambusia affinis]